MKKIVAIVLSLVMVLGMATTAFGAITLWAPNGSTAECDIFEATYNTKMNDVPVLVKFIPGKEVTYNTDGTVKQIGIIPHYVIEEVVEDDTQAPVMFKGRPGRFQSTYDVNFVDEDGNVIASGTTVKLYNAEALVWGAAAVARKNLGETRMAVEGYTYKESSVDYNNLVITFVYSKDIVYYTLTVNYVDQAGNSLAESVVEEGLVEGSEYTTEAATIDGYKLSETPANATGTMDSDVVVDYVYDRLATPITTVIQRYVRVNSIPADADASDYILVKAHDPKAVPGTAMKNQTAEDAYYILKKVDYVNYFAKAAEFKAWSDDCEAYPDPETVDGNGLARKYYTVANKVTGIFDNVAVKYGAVAQGAPVLVDNEIVMLNVRDTVAATQHAWRTSKLDAKGNTTEYTCFNCKTVGAVINASINAPTGYKVDKLLNGDLVAYKFVPAAQAPAGDKVESAQTFDAGIAMYVGMSVMAAAGSAVVLKKKD